MPLIGRPTKLWPGIYILGSLYLVGMAGFAWPAWQDAFAALTPLTLMLSSVVVLWYHRQWTLSFFRYLSALFMAGYLVELLGVKTGAIFGAYHYGATLGTKLFDIPLIIGLNWVLLIYASASVTKYLPLPWWLQAAIAAGFMALLDVFIEPFAIRFDLWNWEAATVPLQNYVAWFVVAWLMQLGFFRLGFTEKNVPAVMLYLLQLLFFIIVMRLV